MTELADWETEGARARPARPGDHEPVPGALRAVTIIGVLFLIAAVCVFVVNAFIPPADETAVPVDVRLLIATIVSVAIAAVGVVALLLRLVAGVLIRR
ncbi:hypothetical protein [Curtobacterium sp. MCBD17_026]|uniref:hypothetical protein n=1 Tax=Curtobacterium sp. MCBD17_026 TaxID=2175621 RepID=UPI000DAACFAE|nr:hypothetical protein [Curtobacterium sp. MCBD17_026]WIB71456.1 hypothetical protein DEI85_03330 [Curtobacterium sp. MCBD17_026]